MLHYRYGQTVAHKLHVTLLNSCCDSQKTILVHPFLISGLNVKYLLHQVMYLNACAIQSMLVSSSQTSDNDNIHLWYSVSSSTPCCTMYHRITKKQMNFDRVLNLGVCCVSISSSTPCCIIYHKITKNQMTLIEYLILCLLCFSKFPHPLLYNVSHNNQETDEFDWVLNVGVCCVAATTLPRGYAVPHTNFSWSLDDWCSVAVRSKPPNGADI